LSFKKKLFKNILTLGGYTYLNRIITFFSSAITSRLLLPKEYGYVALITVFTGFISIFADAGMSIAVIRSDYKKQFQQGLKTITFYMGICLFLLMIALAFPIAAFYNDNGLILPTIVFSSVFILRSMAIVPSAILTKELKFEFMGRRSLIITIINILFTILLAYFGFSFWSLIWSQIFSALFSYLLVEREVKMGLKFYSLAHVKVAYKHSKSLIKNIIGFNAVNYWARNADNLIVGKVYGSADLGIYNRAYTILMMPLQLISGLFNNILFPSLKKHKQEGGDVKKEYEHVLGLLSILNYPIAAVLILFPHPIVSFLWGEAWIQVAELLPYFGLLIFLQSLMTTIGNIFILEGKENANFRIGSILALVMVGFIIWGATYSILGVARLYTLGYLFVNVPANLYFSFIKTFKYPVSFVIKFWLPKLVLSTVLLFSVWYSFKLITAGALLLLLVHICFHQRKEISRLLKTLKRRSPKAV